VLASEKCCVTSAVTPHSGQGINVSTVLPSGVLTATAEDVKRIVPGPILMTLPVDKHLYA